MISPLGSITTRTGRHPVMSDPAGFEVVPEDLRYALSRQCRYAGHCDVTVLQHLHICIQLAHLYGYDAAATAYCAAHDLHEAYVQDIVRPLKALLPDYQRIEALWEAHVHRAVGLEWPLDPLMAQQVKRVDQRAVICEKVLTGFSLDARWIEVHGGPMVAPEDRVVMPVNDDPETWATVWNAVVRDGGTP